MQASQYAMTIDRKPTCVLKFESISNPFTNIQQRLYLTELIDDGYNYFIFDLSRLQYISSEGLNFLLNALTTIRNNGGDMVLAAVTDSVDKLLYMTRLRAVFSILETVEAALETVVAKGMDEG